jgi:glutathione S-transferase
LSPHRRIPVLLFPSSFNKTPSNYSSQDGIVDSTVICEFLNEQYPTTNPLLPKDPIQRARVRWMEEFADSVMGDVLIWRLFNATVIDPGVWKAQRNKEAIEMIKEKEIPQVWDYLEKQLNNPALSTSGKFLVGDVMTSADIAVACFIRNAEMARVTISRDRWPKLHAFTDHMLHHVPEFVRLREFEDTCLKVPPPQHRKAILTSTTDGSKWLSPTSLFRDAEPRKGLLTRVFDSKM